MTKLRPQKWCQLVNIQVLDPDGWDRKAENFEKDWDKPISFNDFIIKSSISTCQHKDKFTLKLVYDSMIACHIFYYGIRLKRKNTVISGSLSSEEEFTFNVQTNEIVIKSINWTFSTTDDNAFTSFISGRIDNVTV